jgi:hypothetical protein
MNQQLLARLFADEDAWCLTTLSRGTGIVEAGWQEAELRARA